MSESDPMLGVLIESELYTFVLAYRGPPADCPHPTPNGFGLELVGIVDEAVTGFRAQSKIDGAPQKDLCRGRVVDALLTRGFKLVMDLEPGHLYGVDLTDQHLPHFRYQDAKSEWDLDHGDPVELGSINRARAWFEQWRSDRKEPPPPAPESQGDAGGNGVTAYGRYITRAPNVFLLAGASEEDWFTGAWHYLLCKRPQVGQRVVDYLSSHSSLPPSRFRFAVDHPLSEERTGDYPDFLVRADPTPILFEHKLTAELGDLQLERYLSSAESMGARLALVAARPTHVSKTVLSSGVYLRPRNRAAAHFFWQDFADLLADPCFEGDDLVHDFLELMDNLGLRRANWAELGDPLLEPDATKAFRQLLTEAANKLRDEAEFVRMAPRNPGIEFRKPAPGIGLVYFLFGARGLVRRGRVVRAQVGVDSPQRLPWIDESDAKDIELLPGAHASIFKGEGRARWNKDLLFARYYEIPFDAILSVPTSDTVGTICSIVRGVLRHVRNEAKQDPPLKKASRRSASR